MIDSNEKLEQFLADNPDLEIFEIILPDMAGGLRGKWITRDRLPKVLNGELKLPVSSLAFDSWGRDVDAWVSQSGDGDGYAQADIDTLVRAPWMSPPTGQILVSMLEQSRNPCDLDPRYILRKVMQRFADRGLTPVVATEMEFHLLQKEPDRLGRPQHTQSDRVGGALGSGQTYCLNAMADLADFMHGVHEACAVQHLPVDTLVSEAAPSQYEINLLHCDNAVRAADQGLMLKRAIRGVASVHGMKATFMAKPFGDLPGNGMHLHCSVLDAAGNNAFNDGTPVGSALLRQAIAGCLTTLDQCMLLFAPHPNSYRRFQRGIHAPMAPSWGYENRTVAIRVPADTLDAMRIEHRVPGTDAQPHLAIAALLGGMLYGIERELEPAPPITGNAYDQLEETLPGYLPDALALFQQSDFIRDVFGERFQQVFALIKQQELDEYDRHVTPLEYDACL